MSSKADSIRTVTERFVAPCCWRENLAMHQSPEAEKMRTEVAQLVAAGGTEDEIVEHYVSQYGERILRVPRGARFRVLTLAPFVFLVLGMAWVLQYLARSRRATPREISGAVLPEIPENELDW
jgi:cytochrome c-type biogenesis protein CcmH